MVIPLILGAVIKTFFPEFLKIGGFTTAIATNPLAIVGVFLVCMGAGMDIQAAPKALKIGLVQTLTKYGIAVIVGLMVGRFFGDQGLWGISALAFIAAMSNTNGGLYTALTAEFGTKQEVGAVSILSINRLYMDFFMNTVRSLLQIGTGLAGHANRGPAPEGNCTAAARDTCIMM